RTPLNAILGFSEMMQNETFGPLGHVNYRDYAADIHKSGANLLTLINDVLDLSRLDDGGIALTKDDMDLRDVIRSVLAGVTQSADAGGVALVDNLGEAPLTIYADPRRI